MSIDFFLCFLVGDESEESDEESESLLESFRRLLLFLSRASRSKVLSWSLRTRAFFSFSEESSFEELSEDELDEEEEAAALPFFGPLLPSWLLVSGKRLGRLRLSLEESLESRRRRWREVIFSSEESRFGACLGCSTGSILTTTDFKPRRGWCSSSVDDSESCLDCLCGNREGFRCSFSDDESFRRRWCLGRSSSDESRGWRLLGGGPRRSSGESARLLLCLSSLLLDASLSEESFLRRVGRRLKIGDFSREGLWSSSEESLLFLVRWWGWGEASERWRDWGDLGLSWFLFGARRGSGDDGFRTFLWFSFEESRRVEGDLDFRDGWRPRLLPVLVSDDEESSLFRLSFFLSAYWNLLLYLSLWTPSFKMVYQNTCFTSKKNL